MTIKQRINASPPETAWESLPLLLTESETVNILGGSISWLRKSRCEGARKQRTTAPPFVRVGGRIFYRKDDLKTWVDNLVPQQVI